MIRVKGTYDVDGIRALESEARQRNVTLKGVRAGVQVLNKAAKAAAPKASGALRTAQGYIAKKGRKGLTLSFAVQGARKSVVKMVRRPGRKALQKAVPAFYDHLVNLGTRPHRVGKGSKLARRGRPGTHQAGGLHPGAAANPFRPRAWAASKDRAGAATVAAMGEELQKQIAQAAAKGK